MMPVSTVTTIVTLDLKQTCYYCEVPLEVGQRVRRMQSSNGGVAHAHPEGECPPDKIFVPKIGAGPAYESTREAPWMGRCWDCGDFFKKGEQVRCTVDPAYEGFHLGNTGNYRHLDCAAWSAGDAELAPAQTGVFSFLAALERLSIGDWVSVVMGVSVDEYEREAEPGRAAMRRFATAPPEELGIAQTVGPLTVARLFPSPSELREHLRPFAARPGITLPQETHEAMRAEAGRRAAAAASAVAVRASLTPSEFSGLYRPFAGFLRSRPPPPPATPKAMPIASPARVTPAPVESPGPRARVGTGTSTSTYPIPLVAGQVELADSGEVCDDDCEQPAEYAIIWKRELGEATDARRPYCASHTWRVLQLTGRLERLTGSTPGTGMDLGMQLALLRVAGVALAILALAFVYSPNGFIDWFLIQSGLVGLAWWTRESRVGSILAGGWLAYFWIPPLAAGLHWLGFLRP